MADVSNEAIKAFAERFNACTVRIGGGKIALDTKALRQLVKENRETAARFVEIYCLQGQSNHAYFQGAMTVAVAYQVAFGDSSLAESVFERAKAAGAEDWLQKMGVLKRPV
jgi:hypothetical protein